MIARIICERNFHLSLPTHGLGVRRLFCWLDFGDLLESDK